MSGMWSGFLALCFEFEIWFYNVEAKHEKVFRGGGDKKEDSEGQFWYLEINKIMESWVFAVW